MADFLSLDFNKFENQILMFIEIYYNNLKSNEDEPLYSNKKQEIGIKWRDQIKYILDKYHNDSNPKLLNRVKSIKEYLDMPVYKGKINLEFYMILDIAEILYETYFIEKSKKNKKKQEDYIINNMVRCIYRELIELRNRLSHDENPSIENILRFYEDQYYLIKYMKPENLKCELSDYITKDIKNNIHIYLSKLLDNNEKVFELEPMKNKNICNEELNKINDDSIINNKIKKEEKEEKEKAIKTMFECTPFKLSKYSFSDSNEENESKEKNDIENSRIINEKIEEEEIYGTSLNSSHNSISSSHISSGRSSLNENTESGNIKDRNEESIEYSKSNIQDTM